MQFDLIPLLLVFSLITLVMSFVILWWTVRLSHDLQDCVDQCTHTPEEVARALMDVPLVVAQIPGDHK